MTSSQKETSQGQQFDPAGEHRFLLFAFLPDPAQIEDFCFLLISSEFLKGAEMCTRIRRKYLVAFLLR